MYFPGQQIEEQLIFSRSCVLYSQDEAPFLHTDGQLAQLFAIKSESAIRPTTMSFN